MAGNAIAGALRRRSNRAIFLMAVVCGVISAILVGAVLASQGGSGGSAAGEVPVVVAARDIPARTMLTADMLEVKQLPADAALRGVFSDPAALEGRITLQAIAAGEPILPVKVAEQGRDRGLAFIVPPGKRALAVNVSEVIGVGGMLIPGDYVDVLVHFEAEEGRPDKVITILQNIPVLSVAQTMQTPAPEGEQGQGGVRNETADPNPEAKTVTLAVTPEEAQALFLAEQTGEIRLALRSFGDSQTRPLGELNINNYR